MTTMTAKTMTTMMMTMNMQQSNDYDDDNDMRERYGRQKAKRGIPSTLTLDNEQKTTRMRWRLGR